MLLFLTPVCKRVKLDSWPCLSRCFITFSDGPVPLPKTRQLQWEKLQANCIFPLKIIFLNDWRRTWYLLRAVNYPCVCISDTTEGNNITSALKSYPQTRSKWNLCAQKLNQLGKGPSLASGTATSHRGSRKQESKLSVKNQLLFSLSIPTPFSLICSQ